MHPNQPWSSRLLPLNDLYSLFNDLGESLFVYKDLVDYRTDAAYTTYRQIVDSVDLLIDTGLVGFSDEKFVKHTESDSISSLATFSEVFCTKILSSNSQLIATLFSNDELTFDSSSSRYTIPFNGIPLQYNGLIFLLDELGAITYNKTTGHIVLANQLIVESVRELKAKNNSNTTPNSLTLSQLKDNLILKEYLGREAEQFALAYERKALIHKGITLVPEIISEMDASKGYDIASYMDSNSITFDKFIEVKSCENDSFHFFISQNELRVAEETKSNYFLYLYNRSSGEFHIIQDPYPLLTSESTDWLSSPSVYSVRKIIS